MSDLEEPGHESERGRAPARLSPRDREAVDEALEEIRSERGPVDRRPLGCVLTLPAFLTLLVVPVLDRRFGLPAAVATPVIAGAVILLVSGLTVWFTAGGFVRGHVAAAAEAALRALEAWSPETEDREEALRAATLLLVNAHATYGPTTSRAFDPMEARRRIGPALPLVEAVERHLVGREAVYPVFNEAGQSDEAR